MDLSTAFPPDVLSLGVVILGATFGTIWAMTQAGLPPKWSYLAALGVGALWGLLLGGSNFGLGPKLFSCTVFGAITGLGTLTAARRPAVSIVAEAADKLGEPNTHGAIVIHPPTEPPKP